MSEVSSVAAGGLQHNTIFPPRRIPNNTQKIIMN